MSLEQNYTEILGQLGEDASREGLELHSYAARLLGRHQPDRDTVHVTR